MNPKATWSRRTFLRGAVGGAAVSMMLPPLEAMFDTTGRALASTSNTLPIFGTFFWANGLPWHAKHTRSALPDGAFNASRFVDQWTPSEQGASYTPTPLLQPLAAHTPTVITGLTPKTNWVTGGETDGHMRGFMVALTSDRVNPTGFHHNSHTLTASRESLDQFVAKHPSFYGSQVPRYRSLHLGISEARFHDYGHWNAISYNGPNSLNPPISSAARLHDLLFAPSASVVQLERRSSVLDAVLEDYRSLLPRLGASDKDRVGAHLEHIFEVQRRLDASELVCQGVPGRPAEAPNLLDQTQLMAELLALGLQCGASRVFTFMLTSPATTHVFSHIPGVRNDMHTTCHAGEWEAVRDITSFQMQAFDRFLTALAARPMTADSSVLDAALVYGTSEYGEGWKHGVEEMPVVFAGGASGRVKLGHHVREVGGNMAKAHTTLLRGLGLEVPSYGFNDAETTEDFSDLLT